jgi:hypothetical protein
VTTLSDTRVFGDAVSHEDRLATTAFWLRLRSGRSGGWGRRFGRWRTTHDLDTDERLADLNDVTRISVKSRDSAGKRTW